MNWKKNVILLFNEKKYTEKKYIKSFSREERMEFNNKKPFIWRDKESGEQNYLQPADWNIQEFGTLIMKCHDSHIKKRTLLFKFYW